MTENPITEALATRLKTEGLPVAPEGVLMLWENLKKKLKQIKDDELEIRRITVKLYVPKPQEGMNNIDLNNGYTLKAGISYNYNLADNKLVETGLDEIAKVGNEGQFIAERLVSWTPNFLLTEYRKLQEDATGGSQEAQKILKIVEKFLIITEAAPSLNIKEPKGKNK